MEIIDIKLDDIVLCTENNSRQLFDDDALKELAASIKAYGVLQPITVTKVGDKGKFYLLIGERRYRAARIAGLTAIPCIVKEKQSVQAEREQQIIENLQRENLTAMELAMGVRTLMANGENHDAIANRLGKSRTRIVQAYKLLKLPEEIHNYFLHKSEAGIILKQRHGEELFSLMKDDGMTIIPENRAKMVELATALYAGKMAWAAFKKAIDTHLNPPEPKMEKTSPPVI